MAQLEQPPASDRPQSQPVAMPKYDVASIKPNQDDDLRFSFRFQPGGRLAATGITLRRLMMTAYQVQGFRIVGGPDWVSSKQWDIQATPERAVSPAQVWPMLRALLENRFQLRVHAERRELPIYELHVDASGSKVPRVKDGETKPEVRNGRGSIQLTINTAGTFANELSYALDRPVIDKTNLSGQFDFAVRWSPAPGEDGGPTGKGLPPSATDRPAPAPDGPSIFTALREQLGLRLKAARRPVKVIVIDSVQLPGPN
jgi:uncharacterized protein (TIGR03435 family)